MHSLAHAGTADWIPLDEIPASVAVLDPRGLIVRTNAAWRNFAPSSKLREGAGPGVNYLDLCRDAGEYALADAIEEVLNGTRPSHRHEYSCLCDGEQLWFRAIIQPRAGHTGAVVYHFDVTRSGDFEGRIQELQKLDIVGRVSGSLAHDFNNLLTAILGHAASLEASRRYSAEDVKAILRTAQHAGSLTRRLLTFSRKHVPSIQRLAVGSFLLELEPLLTCIAGPNVSITLSLPATTCRVSIDPVELEQVVLNLVINARDAMPQGGPVTIRVDSVGGRVGIHVEDRGTGIPLDARERIFEAFYTTKEPGRGTGLGLASVVEIVGRAGGKLDLHSQVGSGSTFSVWLPSAEGETPSQSPPKPQAARGSEGILFVEDDYRVRVPTTRALRELGYQVVVAPSADEALAIPAEQIEHVQLLLTDVQMPGMTGPQLASELRKRTPHLHVLYISGYSEEGLSDGHPDDGPRYYLPKPFTPDTLDQMIRDILHGAVE